MTTPSLAQPRPTQRDSAQRDSAQADPSQPLAAERGRVARPLFQVAAMFATVTVAMGAINSATGSGFACPTWPGCYPGHFGPEAEVHDLIEFSHRIIAALCGFVLLAAAVVGATRKGAHPIVRIAPPLALLGAIGAAVFGMMVVRNHGIAKPLAMIDLFGAMTCLVAMTLAAMTLRRSRPAWRWTPVAKLAGGILAGLYLLHVSGIAVAGPGSFTGVLGWPLSVVNHQDLAPAGQVGRAVLALALVVALALLVKRCWAIPGLAGPARVLLAAMLVETVFVVLVASLGAEMWFTLFFCGAAVAILSAVTVITGRAALDA